MSMNPSSRVASTIPWWVKIAAKVILSRLPVNYKVWKRLHLFEYGDMDEPSYAHGVFRKHFDAARSRKTFNGFVGLELGPGDSLLSAMIAHAYGASAYYLVDVGAFAQVDVKRCAAMADFLADKGLPTIEVDNVTSTEAMLAACRATYGTCGLMSLRTIPDDSVDYILSHTVLQHIRLVEFLETMRELRRLLRPNGISSHWVDLKDCLGGGLNNLRFSDTLWESPFMATSGFYTNRIRYSEILELFSEAGFKAEVLHVKHWHDLPLKQSKLSSRFRSLPQEELRVQGFHVILTPA
jgi:SAM-dependent methyltransferase